MDNSYNFSQISFIAFKAGYINEVGINIADFNRWIENNFHISNKGVENTDCYLSNVDNSYMCQVSNTSMLRFLFTKGITDQVTSSTGFNPKIKKWYGWSHRAICGFGIGSTVDKKSACYVADNKENYIEDYLKFMSEPTDKCELVNKDIKKNGVLGFTCKHKNDSLEMFVPYPESYGTGEWKAKTLDDAKKMAEDFAECVS